MRFFCFVFFQKHPVKCLKKQCHYQKVGFALNSLKLDSFLKTALQIIYKECIYIFKRRVGIIILHLTKENTSWLKKIIQASLVAQW